MTMTGVPISAQAAPAATVAPTPSAGHREAGVYACDLGLYDPASPAFPSLRASSQFSRGVVEQFFTPRKEP